MLKTGLLTFYHIHHYGAMLQAYATERAVESLGSGCEIIDYYVNQDNALFQRPTGLGSAAHDAHTALHYGPLKARYDRFEAFSRDHLNISGRRYESLAELRQADLPYDLLLSGSDQIWNPKIFPNGRFDPVFFGAFSDRRKIAYAPSFGIPRIPDGMEEALRGYLESFSHLSVRERQGQAIVRDIIGQDVPVVLDPTLLLTQADWASVARDGGAGQGYILCYCISRPGAADAVAEDVALTGAAVSGHGRPVRLGQQQGGIQHHWYVLADDVPDDGLALPLPDREMGEGLQISPQRFLHPVGDAGDAEGGGIGDLPSV